MTTKDLDSLEDKIKEKVYIVSDGDPDSHRILGVFMDIVDAKQYCRELIESAKNEAILFNSQVTFGFIEPIEFEQVDEAYWRRSLDYIRIEIYIVNKKYLVNERWEKN